MTGDGGPVVGRRTMLRAGAGLAGGAALAGRGAAQDGEATVRPDWGGWLDGVDGGYRDARGEDEVTVRVGAAGNGGNLAFSPAGLWVDPGTTVVWEWTGEGGGHNVKPEEGPASPDSGDPAAESGTTYEFTFEEDHAGVTKYFCAPHKGLGMLGAVAVGDDVPTVEVAPADGDGGGGVRIPWNARTAFLSVTGGALAFAALAVFGAEAVNGWRRRKRRRDRVEPGPAREAPEAEPAVEIGHDEYDPVGTAALIIAYFLVLVVMWVFMYFVEFLGNGPTVVG